MSKSCSKCGEEKPLDGFHKRKSTKDGHDFWCKDCKSKSYSRYRAENREKILDRAARYRAENQDFLNAANLKHYAESQRLSISLSTIPSATPWTASEETFLLADNGMTIYQKAIEIGRTYKSCEKRIERLRTQ